MNKLDPALEPLLSLAPKGACDGAHVDTGQLIDLAAGDLDEALAAQVIERISYCRDCLSAFRDVVETTQWADSFVSDLQVSREAVQPGKSNVVSLPVVAAPRFRRWLASGAGLAAALLVTVMLIRPTPPDDRLRVTSDPMLEPADRVTLETPPTQFRWPCKPGQVDQRWQLLDHTADVVLEKQVVACHVVLSDGERARIGTGFHVWRVVDPDGQQDSSHSFEVR